MAVENRERQKQFRESKLQAGEARITCWLDKDDNQRLKKLMSMLESENEKKIGYADVISEALKELEISLTPAGQKNLIRYGLRFMESQNNP